MNIQDFALGMGIAVTHIDIDKGTVTTTEPTYTAQNLYREDDIEILDSAIKSASPDCAECDKNEGGNIPRHTADQTVWLCATCDRITPTNQ